MPKIRPELQVSRRLKINWRQATETTVLVPSRQLAIIHFVWGFGNCTLSGEYRYLSFNGDIIQTVCKFNRLKVKGYSAHVGCLISRAFDFEQNKCIQRLWYGSHYYYLEYLQNCFWNSNIWASYVPNFNLLKPVHFTTRLLKSDDFNLLSYI